MSLAAPSGSPQPAERPGGRARLSLRAALKVAVIAVLAVGSAYLLWAHAEWFDDPHRVKAEIVAWGIWGPTIYVLAYAVGPSLLVPGAVMTIAGGLAFGTARGAVYSLVGADLGALVAFAAGRFLGQSFVERIVGERFRPMLEKIARHGFQIILYLRIVPVIPYNALNLLAGASPIGFRDYFWASMIGMVPGTILFAYLGDALWHPTSPQFFLALVLIAACFACGELYRRWRSLPAAR